MVAAHLDTDIEVRRVGRIGAQVQARQRCQALRQAGQLGPVDGSGTRHRRGTQRGAGCCVRCQRVPMHQPASRGRGLLKRVLTAA